MHMRNGTQKRAKDCGHCKFTEQNFETAMQFVFDNTSKFETSGFKYTTEETFKKMVFAMSEAEFDEFLSSHVSEDEIAVHKLECLHCKELDPKTS